METTSVVSRSAVAAWGVLMASTLLSWYLGDGHGPREAATVGIIVVAFVKVYLVGEYFMELRHAPPGLRGTFGGWCLTISGLLIALYLLDA